MPEKLKTSDCPDPIQSHLEEILASVAFAGSKRSQHFLRLVVEHALAGRKDELRERMIGAEMFGRAVDYDTGNDAVVRVKANEVRRRLARYYADEADERNPVRIVPIGSYVPEFRTEAAAEVASSHPPAVLHHLVPHKVIPHKSTTRWAWLLLVPITVAVLSPMMKLTSPRPAAPPDALTRLTWDSGWTNGGAISPDGRFVAYSSDRAGNGYLDIYVQEIESGSVVRYTDYPANDYDPVFSPDGANIAFRSDRTPSGIYQVSTLGGEARLIVPGGRGPRFSPDGRYLLYWQSRRVPERWGGWGANLFTQELAGGTPVRISGSCGNVGGRAVWSPDSQRILFAAICGGESGIWVASPDGKTLKKSRIFDAWKEQKLRSADPETIAVFDQWLDAPYRLLATFRQGDDVTFEATLPIAPDGGQATGPAKPLMLGPSTVTQASVSATGRMVLSDEEQDSHIWELAVDSSGRAVGDPIQVTTGSSLNLSPALTRDGKTLAFVAHKSRGWQLQVMNLSGGTPAPIGMALPYLGGVVLGPNGKIDFYGWSPATQSMTYFEVPVAGGTPRTTLENPKGAIWDISPTGPWQLSLGEGAPTASSTIDLSNTNTGITTTFLAYPDSNLFQAHFSTDGRWVVFNGHPNRQSRIYIVPFGQHAVPVANWISITDGTDWDDKPRFSSDDKLVYFVCDRDGFRCIWAQPLTPDMHPKGTPFAVYHFHSRRRSIGNIPMGKLELAVGPGMLVFPQAEFEGNLWLLDQAGRQAP